MHVRWPEGTPSDVKHLADELASEMGVRASRTDGLPI
jgi:hypothetical protein